MVRSDFFAMRINDEDRKLIARLAAQEQRTASDAIRVLIRQAVKEERAPADRQDGALAVSKP